MIKTIDGKIHHLKQLDFIERTLAGEVLSPEEFYKEFAKFLEKNFDLVKKTYWEKKDLEKLDEFTKGFFDGRIETAKQYLVRAYVVGRFLSTSDVAGQIFQIEELSKLPRFVQDAAKKYGLSLQEAKALQQAIEEGAANMSNTTASTIQTVRNAIVESTKVHGDAGTVLKNLERLFIRKGGEVGELNRDWMNVAITETNRAFNEGYIANLREGDMVVGFSLPDACDSCMTDINGQVYRVRKDSVGDYSEMKGEEKKQAQWSWENEIWVGKSNYGRSPSKRKRINPLIGNKKDNLREKHHHEFSMPVIPYHPRCFQGNVEIYTEKGWQRFDELQKGIKVATINTKSLEMTYQQPYEYIEDDFNGTMYKLIGKNIDIDMTEGHNILTGVRSSNKDRSHKDYRLIPVEKLNSERSIPISCNYEGEEKNIQIGRHSIPEELFAKLMGYYLSEGSAKSKKHGWEVKISQSKPLNNETIYNDLKPLNVTLRQYEHSIQFNDKDICEYLKATGLQPARYIPKEIKNMSKKGLRTFLSAYVLGDGTIKNSGKKLKGQKTDSIGRVIFTSSKKMADDLTEVIMKAGFSVSYKLITSKGKKQKFRNGEYIINHDIYRISIKNSKHVNKFDIKKYDYNGKTYCVSVPNETILVRNNGKVLWVGNCRCRWVVINTEYQFIDKDGQLRMRVEDEDAYREWYDREIATRFNIAKSNNKKIRVLF